MQVSHEIQQQPLRSSPPQKKDDLGEEGFCEQLRVPTEPDIPFSRPVGKKPYACFADIIELILLSFRNPLVSSVQALKSCTTSSNRQRPLQ